MNPSMANMATTTTTSSASYVADHSNPNLTLANFYPTPPFTSIGSSSNNHFIFPNFTSPSTRSSMNHTDLLNTWNYHRFLTSTLTTDHLSDNSASDYYKRSDFFPQYYPRSLQKSLYQQPDDEILLKKFHRDTLVSLDTGESKNIQQLTENDLLKSAKQSHQYSSLLARVDFIGSIDKLTGRVEIRFGIVDMGQTASCYVLQAVPFFVHQYSCWSSISPEHTRRLCGLNCRQLECGDIVIAITEQQRKSISSSSSSSSSLSSSSSVSASSKRLDKSDSNRQISTKYLNGRCMKEQISSSNKRYKISNE